MPVRSSLAMRTIVHDLKIEPLSNHTNFISIVAKLHFAQFKELTGASTEKNYATMLNKFAATESIPTTLVTVRDNELCGSVNIVDCDMGIRSELYPWLAQLFVVPTERKKGIGSSLVSAAVDRCQRFGLHALYLYASGILPAFYKSLGWVEREKVNYQGKERVVMEKQFSG
jgi:predicted N-acetyltransferase YhbS